MCGEGGRAGRYGALGVAGWGLPGFTGKSRACSNQAGWPSVWPRAEPLACNSCVNPTFALFAGGRARLGDAAELEDTAEGGGGGEGGEGMSTAKLLFEVDDAAGG